MDADVPQEVCTDGTLLWRCLMNYVTNAIKAAGRVPAPPGGKAWVDVRVSKVQADDTGVASRVAFPRRVFDAAQQPLHLNRLGDDLDAAAARPEAVGEASVEMTLHAPWPEAPASAKGEDEGEGEGEDGEVAAAE